MKKRRTQNAKRQGAEQFMVTRDKVSAIAVCTLAAVMTAGGARSVPTAGSSHISGNIADYLVRNLKDFSCTLHVLHYNDAAGRKINKDFGSIYKLKGNILLRYKEQNMLRLDAHLGPARASLVVNGATQYVKIPAVGIRTVSNLGDSPGKRKTLLDVGLLSPAYLTIAQAQFLGVRPVYGVPCACFNLQYHASFGDTSHRLVWIDPRTHVVVKREEYSQKGKINAIYYYRDPIQAAPGIWFPTRIEAVNNEGEEAGETAYTNIKVNVGLPDSLFKL
ncbi:MAG: outer membrane lipoprotein-sorting protein [Armatimonadetes bacterium]|nr:outer membrane lipoprotein-sorting protein [Armatimonadota bacterium]MDE2205207.1 outer membrane lipoprotein-sorting protein [Armatimonadota bacterium]